MQSSLGCSAFLIHVIHVTQLVLVRLVKQKFGHMTRYPTFSVKILPVVPLLLGYLITTTDEQECSFH